MRHGLKGNHLKRKKGHRAALLKNMLIALITHKRIVTTLAKAKALRIHAEPIITKSKTNTTHSRRVAFSYLQDKIAVQELFGPIAEKIADRPGGYLRIIKTGFRKGDGGETAMIEFVDFNDVYDSSSKAKSGGKRTRRRGKGATKKAAETVVAATAAAKTVADSEEE